MNWWLLIPAVLAYLGVGLVGARLMFINELGETARLQADDCTPRFCTHKITMVDGKRHRPTKVYSDARAAATFTLYLWPLIVIFYVVVTPIALIWRSFDTVINRPTKAEKQTQRQRELAALSTRAKELGLPVPEEWTQDNDPMGGIVPAGLVEKSQLTKDREWIDRRTEELARLRNPERYEAMEQFEKLKIRNKYGKPIWIDEPS